MVRGCCGCGDNIPFYILLVAKEKFVDCYQIVEFENKQRKRKKHIDESNDLGHNFNSRNRFKMNTFDVICDNLTA